ncbi:MAG: hypothetical protein KDD50_09840 [Bdellovibrionales bacterium]|nr:hypothetical protein [Bdellovibrionales bacterium]
MKTKFYKHGTHKYKAYYKSVGHGYEVGFCYGKKTLFVGNFLHAKEANGWFKTMTSEIEKFSKKYWISPKAPKAFYNKFMTNHLYKTYYAQLDKWFDRYNRSYTSSFKKDERKYKQLKKNWKTTEKTFFKKAA